MNLVLQLLRPLIVTILLEGITAWICGFRGRRKQLQILLVNVITNPAVNITGLFLSMYFPLEVARKSVPALEILVVLVEGLLFRYFLDDCRHPFLLSMAVNAVSFWIGGLILPYLR